MLGDSKFEDQLKNDIEELETEKFNKIYETGANKRCCD